MTMQHDRKGHLRKRARRRIAFVVITLASAFSFVAVAQPKKPAARSTPSAPNKKGPAKTDDLDASTSLATKESSDLAASTRDAGKGGAVVEQKQLDGGPRVFRFGEVEVEGRLKSPQIVYFLRRVRAEFAAGDLGHRSFIRELGETKNEPSF